MGTGPGSAMRLLPIRSDDASSRLAEAEPQADGPRYRRGDVGQYLPVRHISKDSPGNQGRSKRELGGEVMSERVQLASRRDFLSAAFSAGALILGARFIPAQAAEAQTSPDITKMTWNPSLWIGLNTDGSVVIVAHRSEMGTGIRTTLPMVLADEMEADWSKVHVQQAIGSEKYGSQN